MVQAVRARQLSQRHGSSLPLGRGLGLGFHLGLFLAQARIHFCCFRGMNRVIVLVRFGQLFAVVEQSAEAIRGGQLKLVVHLDGLERTNFNADLAAHANRNIDVEPRGIKLLLAHKIRLLVLAFVDVDALGRALFLADLASHAAQCRPPNPLRRTPERETRARPRRQGSAAPDTAPWSAVLWRRSCRRNSSPSPPFPSGCLHQATPVPP